MYKVQWVIQSFLNLLLCTRIVQEPNRAIKIIFLVLPQRLYKADLDGAQERRTLNSFFLVGLFFLQ